MQKYSGLARLLYINIQTIFSSRLYILGETVLAGMRARFFILFCNCGTIFDVNIARIHLFFIVDFGQERGAQGCAPVRFFLYAKSAFL